MANEEQRKEGYSTLTSGTVDSLDFAGQTVDQVSDVKSQAGFNLMQAQLNLALIEAVCFELAAIRQAIYETERKD